MSTAVRRDGVVATAMTAAVATTTASRCGQRGHKEQRDHRERDAAAAHGTLHRRSVARRGATGTVLYLKHPKWATGQKRFRFRLQAPPREPPAAWFYTYVLNHQRRQYGNGADRMSGP